MKKKFLNNYVCFFIFVFVFLISVFWYFSSKSGVFYFWGRKIDLKPNYLFSLDYKPGQFLVYEIPKLDAENDNEMLNNIQKSASSRINLYHHQKANISLEKKDGQTLLLVETPTSISEETLDQLLTVPGRLRFFIQKENISEEEMILSDEWLSGFDLLDDVSENDLISAKAQIDFQTKQPVISLVFNDSSRKTLLKETRENISKILMVMLDDSIVLMSPISEPIFNGKIVISGGQSLYEAEIYAAILASSKSSIVPILLDKEVEIDIKKYQIRPEFSLFGLISLDQWQGHLFTVFAISFLLLILTIVRYRSLGIAASLGMVFIFFLNFIFICLVRIPISFELVIAIAITWLWLLSINWLFLTELRFLEDTDMTLTEAVKKVFSPHRKIIRRSLAIILLSVIVITSISKSKFFGYYSSASFVQAMQQISVFNIFMYSITVFLITKLFDKK